MNQDILSDVLRSVRLRGALYFHVSGANDWAAEAPSSREIAAAVMPGSEHVMEFHVVLSGSCWGGLVDGVPVRLAAGDLILFRTATRMSFPVRQACGRRQTQPATLNACRSPGRLLSASRHRKFPWAQRPKGRASRRWFVAF